MMSTLNPTPGHIVCSHEQDSLPTTAALTPTAYLTGRGPPMARVFVPPMLTAPGIELEATIDALNGLLGPFGHVLNHAGEST
jgi:hypothetical protein